MIKKLWEKYKEIIMYLIFGVLTTVVSWVSYALFTFIIPDFSLFGYEKCCTATSNVLSWICAVLFAFITNKLWVFNSKSFNANVLFKELWQFVSSRLATGVVEWVGQPLLVYIGLDQTVTVFGLEIEDMVAKAVVSVIVVVLNYVFSKLFVFKKPKDNAENSAADK